jgi:mRNA interferase MazF
MTIYSFGDVLLVPFPFTDQTTTKKRPTIVISSDSYNQSKPDILLIAVTSQVKTPLQLGEMLITEWSKAGLLKSSVIKPIITTLEKQLVIKRLGKLETLDIRALQSSLQQIIEISK